MNEFEKKVALAKKNHGHEWKDYMGRYGLSADYVFLVIEKDDQKAIELEVIIDNPFNNENTFGTTYFTNGSPFIDEWEVDNNEITLADLSKEQIKKAKEIWKKKKFGKIL